jgi:hypothetical protein
VKDARDIKVIPRLWKILLVKERLMRWYISLLLDGMKVTTALDSNTFNDFKHNNKRNQKGGSSSSSSSSSSSISPVYIILGVPAFFGVVLVLLTGKV